MTTRTKLNSPPGKLPPLAFIALTAVAIAGAGTVNANDPPTVSEIADRSVQINGAPTVINFVINDLETPPGSLEVSATSSNQTLIPEANLNLGGTGSNRTVIITPVKNVFGTAGINLTVTDAGSLETNRPFFLKITPVSPPLPPFACSLGTCTPLIRVEGLANVMNVTEEMLVFGSNPPALALNGQQFLPATGIQGIRKMRGTNIRALGLGQGYAIDALELFAGFEVGDRRFFAVYDPNSLASYVLGLGPAPITLGPTVGSDLPVPGINGEHFDATPDDVVDFAVAGAFAMWACHEANGSAFTHVALGDIGLISTTYQVGNDLPIPRFSSPPPGTANTLFEVDARVSANQFGRLFGGVGTALQGLYSQGSNGQLHTIVEDYSLASDRFGNISGWALHETSAIFSGPGGIYQRDIEAALPLELILPKDFPYLPGKTFSSGSVARVAGDYAAIDGFSEVLDQSPAATQSLKDTIFRLNLNDLTLQEIVQEGDEAPGGGVFGVLQNPGVSDRHVAFEGFDASFQFLGLFARDLVTGELKSVVRVGENFDGKEVRTVSFNPGALDGPAIGFAVYFTDGSSGAYLAAPIPESVPFANISTRLAVGTGDDAGIGGFINTLRPTVSKSAPLNVGAKQVVVRAIGPSLADFGVSGALADPVLELHLPDGSVVSNDNWRDTQEEEIMEAGLAPNDDLEAAILTTLEPGAYTAIVRGSNDSTGVGLVEIYDLDGAAVSELGNISTRGSVQTGDGVMIGGFIVGGTESTASTMVVRAIGPSLEASGVANALQDPTLELHDGSGALVASNDNWKDSQQSELEDSQLAPTDDREAALQIPLGPGLYTAIVRGAGDTSGVALVEAYNLEAGGAPAAFPVSLTNLR